MPRKTYRRKFSLVIAAGGNAKLDRSGSMFAIKEASAEFDFEFDDNGQESGEGGVRFETGEDVFSKITLYNRSATVALVVTGWTGLGSGVPGVFYDYLRERQTKRVSFTGTFAGSTLITFKGVSPTISEDAVTAAACLACGVPPGSRRRQIIISTKQTTDLSICDVVGTVGTVIAGSGTGTAQYTEATDDDVCIKGDGTGGRTYYVTQIFNV